MQPASCATAEGGEMEQLAVRRETTVEAGPGEVWEALTDEGCLTEWLAEDAEVDLSEGGEISFSFEDGARTGRIERVDEERRLTLTWERPGYGESRVDFAIEPAPGGTRVVVTERALTAFETTAAAKASWWTAKLGALRATLALVPA